VAESSMEVLAMRRCADALIEYFDAVCWFHTDREAASWVHLYPLSSMTLMYHCELRTRTGQ
jgi:hypothetical protein